MKPKHRRLWFVVVVLAALSGAVGLSLYALQDNISYFYSPSKLHEFRQANDARVAAGRVFRLGGLVVENSLHRRTGDDLDIRFDVTDGVHTASVVYRGIAPDLFGEGQGVVARGALRADGVFEAAELLAKHDENYMPPEVNKALREAHDAGRARLEGAR